MQTSEVSSTQFAFCTLCSKSDSPGFYTGCMCKDLGPQNGWDCDGHGNLTKVTRNAMEVTLNANG